MMKKGQTHRIKPVSFFNCTKNVLIASQSIDQAGFSHATWTNNDGCLFSHNKLECIKSTLRLNAAKDWFITPTTKPRFPCFYFLPKLITDF